MPFIDEDRLYENIEEKYKFAQGEARKAYSDVLDTICEMPEADVREIRYAKRISYHDDYGNHKKCSVCGRRLSAVKAKYCSNCGSIFE